MLPQGSEVRQMTTALQENELIKRLEDLSRRLMDGYHDGPVAAGDVSHGTHDDRGGPGIQTTRWLVHKED